MIKSICLLPICYLSIFVLIFRFANLLKSVDLLMAWYFFVTLYYPTFFVLFLSITTKLNLLVSLHEEVCIDLNFIYYLLLSLSLSLSLSLYIYIYISPSLSLSLPLSLLVTSMLQSKYMSIYDIYVSVYDNYLPICIFVIYIYLIICIFFSWKYLFFFHSKSDWNEVSNSNTSIK